jgi:hypothetical protein
MMVFGVHLAGEGRARANAAMHPIGVSGFFRPLRRYSDFWTCTFDESALVSNKVGRQYLKLIIYNIARIVSSLARCSPEACVRRVSSI